MGQKRTEPWILRGKLDVYDLNAFSLRRYFEACKKLERLRYACARASPEDVSFVCGEVELLKSWLQMILANNERVAADKSKPQYLRRYTVGSVVCAALTCCVDMLAKADKNQPWDKRQIAVDVLDVLVSQEVDESGNTVAASVYLPDFRGHWFIRAIELFKQRPVDFEDKVLSIL